jgi:hypothetical protein
VDGFVRRFAHFSHGKVVSADWHADAGAIGRPGETVRRIQYPVKTWLALAKRNAASRLGVWCRLHDLHDNLFGVDTEAVDHSFGNPRHQRFLLLG